MRTAVCHSWNISVTIIHVLGRCVKAFNVKEVSHVFNDQKGCANPRRSGAPNQEYGHLDNTRKQGLAEKLTGCLHSGNEKAC